MGFSISGYVLEPPRIGQSNNPFTASPNNFINQSILTDDSGDFITFTVQGPNSNTFAPGSLSVGTYVNGVPFDATGILSAGDTLVFLAQYGVTYTIASIVSGTITLASPYTGAAPPTSTTYSPPYPPNTVPTIAYCPTKGMYVDEYNAAYPQDESLPRADYLVLVTSELAPGAGTPLQGVTFSISQGSGTPAPILVSTNSPHGLSTGQTVIISGLQGALINPNGVYQITVTGLTGGTFTLNGTTWTAEYAGAFGGIISLVQGIPGLLINVGFGWTKNEVIQRFDYDSTAGKFTPLPGSAITVVGQLDSTSAVQQLTVAPPAQALSLEVSNVNSHSGHIRVFTTLPHGLVTGELVIIAGVVGVPGTNSVTLPSVVPVAVTVLTTTSFTLNGSTFSGAYVSGGTVLPVGTYASPYRLSLAAASGSGITLTTTVVLNDTFFTAGGPSSVDVELSLSTGDLNWNPATLANNSGSNVWWQQQQPFPLGTDANIGTLSSVLGSAGILLNPIPGLCSSGAAASIAYTPSPPTVTVSGLAGMTPASVGQYLVITGAAYNGGHPVGDPDAGNNGSFLITSFVSTTSVTIANSNAGLPAHDGNNGSINWSVPQNPLIRIGFLTWLQVVPRATENDFSPAPGNPGTVEWAMNTGLLNFSTFDLTNSDGTSVYYDGILYARDIMLPRLPPIPITSAPSTQTINLPTPATGDLIFFVSYDPLSTSPFPFYQFPYYSVITTPDTSGGTQGTVEILQNSGQLQFSSSDQSRFSTTAPVTPPSVTLVYGDLLIDHGVSMRFFRCPVNLTGQNSSVKDVTAFYNVKNAVWASPIIASPLIFLPATPIDDDTLQVSVGQGTGTFVGPLNRVDIPQPTAGIGYMLDFDNDQLTFGQYLTNVLIPIVQPSGFVQLNNPLVLATNFSASLETGLNTNIFTSLTQNVDYLLNAQAGTVTFITTLGVELATSSSGSFSGSPLTTFTDPAANFTLAGVAVGDYLLVLTGSASGAYGITAFTSTTLTTDVPAPSPALGEVSYQILSGIEILADRFFQTITLTDPTTSVERIIGLGPIQNATTIVPSSTASFLNLTTLSDPPKNFTTLGVLPGDTIDFTPENGTAASFVSVSGPTPQHPQGYATVTGLALTGLTSAIVGQGISFSGAASGGNNGTFEILSLISTSSITVAPTLLVGTMGVSNGSSNVSTKADQTSVVSPGDVIIFAFQAGTTYAVATVTTTHITLTSNYTGTTNSQTTAYLPHTVDANNGHIVWSMVQNSGTRLVQTSTTHTLTPTFSFSSVDESKYTVTRRLQIPVAYIGTVRIRFGFPSAGTVGTFSTAVNVVAQDADFSNPTSLAQGVVEVSSATGNLNFSSADITAGLAIYSSRRLALNTDYLVQPVLGLIKFQTRLLTGEEVLMTYVQAPPSTTPPTQPMVFTNERGTFLVRKELVQAHPNPTAVLNFNPTGKAVATNPASSVWRGGRPQQIPRQVSVNAATSTITFNQEIQLQTALPIGTPISPIENVYIDYYVYQAMGGEQTLTVLNPPLLTAQVLIVDGNSSMLLSSNQLSNFPAGFLLLVNTNEVYQLGVSTYDPVANATTIILAGTQVFQSDETNPPLQVASGPTPTVSTPGNPSYFVADLTPFSPIARGMNVITIPGNDLTQSYQTNSILYVTDNLGSFTDFYLVTASKFTPPTYAVEGHTTITLGSNTLRQYTFGQQILSYSVRPIFATAPTTVYTANPPVTTQPSTIIRRVNGQVGQILTTPTGYTFDATGSVVYATPLNPNEFFAIFYTGSTTVAAGPRLEVAYAFAISPDLLTNGLLGQALNANYTLFAPDNFYYRVETMTNFKGQVAQALQQAAQSGSPSGGPMTSNSSSPTLYQQGRPGLWFPEGDYANQDIVAQTSLKYFNDAINYLEDFLHAVDGRIVGDKDGRFLFDGVLGRFDYFTYNPALTALDPSLFPAYPLQSLIQNQIDDYVQNASFPWPLPTYPQYLTYFQQAYTYGLGSRFFPSTRTVWTQNPAIVSTNPSYGDVVGTFTFQNLTFMPMRVVKRLPRAQTQFDYPYGTSTFIVNNTLGDGTLLPPWWDSSTSAESPKPIPPLVPPSPAQILGMLVVIVDPAGNYYLDEQDNARVVAVSIDPPSISISAPAHQPAGTGGSPPSPTPISGASASLVTTINGSTIAGTFHVSHGSMTVPTTADQTSVLTGGTSVIVFTEDVTQTPYLVASLTSSTLTLGVVYSGVSHSTSPAILAPGYFTVSGLLGVPLNYGMTPATTPPTITLSGATLSGGNNGTFNVVPGSVTSTSVDITANLLGTFTTTSGTSVTTSQPQSSFLVPGYNYIVFASQPGTAYLVSDVATNSITLSTAFTGSPGMTTAFTLNLGGTFDTSHTGASTDPIPTLISQVGILLPGSDIIFMSDPTATVYTIATVLAASITLTSNYTGGVVGDLAYMPLVAPDNSNGNLTWVLPQTFVGTPGVIPAGSTIYTSPFDNCGAEWDSQGITDTGATGTYSFNYKVGWDVNLNTQQGTVLYQDVWWPFNGNSLIKFPTFIIPESDYIVPIYNGDILEVAGAGVGVNYTAPYKFPALTGQQLDDDGNITIPIVGPTFDGETTSGGGGPLNLEATIEAPYSAGPPVAGDFRTYTTTAPLVAQGTLSAGKTTITLTSLVAFPFLPVAATPSQGTDPKDFDYSTGLGPLPKEYDLVRIMSLGTDGMPSTWRTIKASGVVGNTVIVAASDAFTNYTDGHNYTFVVAISETSDPNCTSFVPNLGTATVSGVDLVDSSSPTSPGPFLTGPVTVLANTYGQEAITGDTYGTTLINNIIPVPPATASDPVNWGLLTGGYGVVSIGDIVTGSGIASSSKVTSIGPGSSITVSPAVTGGYQGSANFLIQLTQPPPAQGTYLGGTFDTTLAATSPFKVATTRSQVGTLTPGVSTVVFGADITHTSYTVATVTATYIELMVAYAGTTVSHDNASVPRTFSADLLINLAGILSPTGTATGAILATPNNLANLVDPTATFGSAYVGTQITITGAANAANNGSFLVVAYVPAPIPTPTPPQPEYLQISNPNAVSNDYGGGTQASPTITWSIQPVPCLTNVGGGSPTALLGLSVGDAVSGAHIHSNSVITKIGPGPTLTLNKVPTLPVPGGEVITVVKSVATDTSPALPTPWSTTVDTINPFPLFLPPNTQSNALGFTTESYVSGGGVPYTPPTVYTYLAAAPVAPYTSFLLTAPPIESVVQGPITVFVPPTVQVGWTVVLLSSSAVPSNVGYRRQITAVKSTSELTLNAPFPNNSGNDSGTYRVDNPLNTYNGPTLTALEAACQLELDTIYQSSAPTFPPYVPNELNEQQAILAFFDTVFTTILSSNNGQVTAGAATLTDNSVDFFAAEVNTSYLVYVEPDLPPYTIVPLTASTQALPGGLLFTPVPGPRPLDGGGAGEFTTGLSPDPTLYIQVGDSIVFSKDDDQKSFVVESVTAPAGATPGSITITAPYDGTAWADPQTSPAYNLNVLTTTDTAGCVAGDLITGPGIPTAPPTEAVSVVTNVSIRISAPAGTPIQLDAAYTITDTGPQFANMGVYGIGTVTSANVLTLTFVTPAVGFAATTTSLKYSVVTQFGTSLGTLQNIFSIIEANATFIIATTTFLNLLQASVDVQFNGSVDSGAIANGINDLSDDLGNRYAGVNDVTGRLAYLDPTKASGPVSIIETALNTTDQLYAYRYAWINARINLASGYLVLLNSAVTTRIATQASILNSLIQLLTVQGS